MTSRLTAAGPGGGRLTLPVGAAAVGATSGASVEGRVGASGAVAATGCAGCCGAVAWAL